MPGRDKTEVRTSSQLFRGTRNTTAIAKATGGLTSGLGPCRAFAQRQPWLGILSCLRLSLCVFDSLRTRKRIEINHELFGGAKNYCCADAKDSARTSRDQQGPMMSRGSHVPDALFRMRVLKRVDLATG